jgi:hypothetical protein
MHSTTFQWCRMSMMYSNNLERGVCVSPVGIHGCVTHMDGIKGATVVVPCRIHPVAGHLLRFMHVAADQQWQHSPWILVPSQVVVQHVLDYSDQLFVPAACWCMADRHPFNPTQLLANCIPTQSTHQWCGRAGRCLQQCPVMPPNNNVVMLGLCTCFIKCCLCRIMRAGIEHVLKEVWVLVCLCLAVSHAMWCTAQKVDGPTWSN